jgi:hypothetical protein
VTPPDVTPLPRVVVGGDADDPSDLLRELQLLLLRHPVAMQGLVRALVAEGRRFADTPAGARWQRRLMRSELVRRGRALWESSALGMIEERSATVLPSALLDAVLGALTAAEPEALFDQLLGGATRADDR